MFDTLTLAELFALHTKLYNEGQELHARFMALPVALSEEANVLLAKSAEISEAMKAVYDETIRREQETRIPAPANADGADHEHPMPDYSQIPGYGPQHSATEVYDLDTGERYA